MQKQGKLGEMPIPQAEMEQAAQGGDDVILPDTQTLGGN